MYPHRGTTREGDLLPLITHRRAIVRLLALAAVTLAAGRLIGGMPLVPWHLSGQRTPVPVYTIEAGSGEHKTMLPGQLAPVGLPQVPVPVDVDGDGFPDLDVSVGLIDARAILGTPGLQPARLIAPNVTIVRDQGAVAAGRPSPPAWVRVNLTIVELGGTGPDLTISYGYDTKADGTIPSRFTTTLGGLESGFNPITAVLDSGPPGTTTPASYTGPLEVRVATAEGNDRSDVRLAYRPLPETAKVVFSKDEAGIHLTHNHTGPGEVDAGVDAKLVKDAGTTTVSGRIERLPRTVQLDLATDGAAGTADLKASSADADIRLGFTRDAPDGAVRLQADIAGLPTELHGSWDFDPSRNPQASFMAPAEPVGAIETRVETFLGPPPAPRLVPQQAQYATLQTAGYKTMLAARVTSLSRFRYAKTDGGFELSAKAGDGVLPLHAQLDLDKEIVADATVRPLPREFGVTVAKGPPLTFAYDADQPTDVEGSATIRSAKAARDSACDGAFTICARLDARRVPSHLVAVADTTDPEHLRLDIDALPRGGVAAPDVDADITIGPDDGRPFPIVAQAAITGVPRHTTVLATRTRSGALERFDLHACMWDPAAGACRGADGDRAGSIAARVRTFVSRPDGLPALASAAPLHATVAVLARRGKATEFEASARVEDFAHLAAIVADGVVGLRSDVGGGKDLELLAELRGVEFGRGPGALSAAAKVTRLPGALDLCVAPDGTAPDLTAPAPFLDACARRDPFGDRTSPDRPVVFAYNGSDTFGVDARVEVRDAEQRVYARLAAADLPREIRAVVQAPRKGAEDRTVRALVTAPGASHLKVDFAAERTAPGDSCDAPSPSAELTCVAGTVEGLPSALSVRAVPANDRSDVQFHTCDWLYSSSACRPGTAGVLGSAAVRLRTIKGDAVAALPPARAGQAQHLAVALRRSGDANMALAASARIDGLEHATFRQLGGDGFAFTADTQGGKNDLAVAADVDTRDGADRLLLKADATVDPLPSHIEVRKEAKTAEWPLRAVYAANSPTTVDGRVEVRNSPGQPCGAATLCATARVENLPSRVELRVGTTAARKDVELDTSGDGSATTITADVALGVIPDTPLYAHAALTGLPPFTRLRMDGSKGAVDSLGLHTCKWTPETSSCEKQTEGVVGSIDAAVRTFALRPADFPAPAAEGAAQRVWVGVRPGHVEAAVRLSRVSHVEFVDRKAKGRGLLKGVRVVAGDGKTPLTAAVDIDDGNARLAVDAAVSALPSSIEFCLRNPGAVDLAGLPGYAKRCQPETDIFPGERPLVVGYAVPRGATPRVVTHVSRDETAADGSHLGATIDLSSLPEQVVAAALLPSTAGRPVRIRYDAVNPPAGVSATFDIRSTSGDAICRDPRPGAAGVCIRGTLTSLPDYADLYYDRSDQTPGPCGGNVCVTTVRPGSRPDAVVRDLRDLDLSLALPPATSGASPTRVVVTGSLLGLPATVTGTIHLPVAGVDGDEPGFSFSATPAVGRVTIDARNYVGEAPLPAGPPARAGVQHPDVLVLQRGDFFRASTDVADVSGVGYAPVRGITGSPGATKTVALDFAHASPVLRAYVDLLSSNSEHLIADVVARDVPAGMTACLRLKPQSGAVPNPTWCDQNALNASAIRFATSSAGLDVDALVRLRKANGEILAIRARADDIPQILEAVVPVPGGDLTVDAGGFAMVAGTKTPASIGRLQVDASNFDIADAGFDPRAVLPYDPAPARGFAMTPSQRPHVLAVVRPDGFQVSALVGGTFRGRQVSRLTHVTLRSVRDHAACPQLESPPAGYPEYPLLEEGESYVCGRIDFDQGLDVYPGPLDMRMDLVKDERVFALRDAGLVAVPRWVQFTIAQADTVDRERGSFLPRCTANAMAARCAPPLVRFDQPSDALMFGVFETYATGDGDALAAVKPRRFCGTVPSVLNLFPTTQICADPEPLAETDVAPYPAAWTDNGVDAWSNWATPGDDSPRGVRAKVLLAGSETQTRPAVRAAFRLGVPRTLTIEPVQVWQKAVGAVDDAQLDTVGESWKALDVRFRLLVTDGAGAPAGPLGQMSAIVQTRQGDQILIGGPDLTRIAGAPIPGDVSLDMWQRTDRKLRQDFFQIDGRIDARMDASVRLRPAPSQASVPFPVNASLRNLPYAPKGYPDGVPSFRVRAEILGARPTYTIEDCKVCIVGEPRIAMSRLDVDLNLEPVPAVTPVDPKIGPVSALPARLVEAVVRTNGGVNGIEVAGFNLPDVKGATPQPTPVGIKASLNLNPMTIQTSRDLAMVLDGTLTATVNARAATNLAVRQNIAHVSVEHAGLDLGGPGATVDVRVPLTRFVAIANLAGALSVAEVHLANRQYPAPHDLAFAYMDCPPGTTPDPPGPSTTLSVPANGSRDVIPWPFTDPDIKYSTVVVAPGVVRGEYAKAACNWSLQDIELIHMAPRTERRGTHPGDPVADRLRERPVPDARDANPAPGVRSRNEGTPTKTTITQPSKLCGPHHFDELYVYADVTVPSTEEVLTDSTGSGPDCLAANAGRLQLSARYMEIGKHISADGARLDSTVPPSSNGGGGNFFGGGRGSAGDGGPGILDTSDAPQVGTGSAGGSVRGGDGAPGGGSISITAGTLKFLSGAKLSANGFNGRPGDLTAKCADAPELAGGGGGAGGGVAIRAVEIQGTAVLMARGGSGGAGSGGDGGGGAGGVVKTWAAISGLGAPDIAAGGSGASGCGKAEGGGAGASMPRIEPMSTGLATARFWFDDTQGARVGYDAAAYDYGGHQYQVYLCGVHLPGVVDPSAPVPMPNGRDVSNPCGDGVTLGVKTVTQARVRVEPSDPAAFVLPTLQPNGTWAFWTVITQPVGLSCSQFGGATCAFEQVGAPDLLLGVDTIEPLTTVRAPAENAVVAQGDVAFSIDGTDRNLYFERGLPVQAQVSGVERAECRNENEPGFRACTLGEGTWTLSPGDGAKTVAIRTVDRAGVRGLVEQRHLVVDSTPPSLTITPTPIAGWTTTRPTVTMTATDAASAVVRIDYRIDGSSAVACANPCSLPTSGLAVGVHAIEATGVDAVGNRYDLGSPSLPAANRLTLKLDDRAPDSRVEVIRTPTRPGDLAVITALDQLGGSGVSRQATTYRLDGRAAQPYESYVALPPAAREICWTVADTAGNTSAERCEALHTDAGPPLTETVLPAPDGANGWYRTPPSVDLRASDDMPLGPRPIRWRLDNDAEERCGQTCTVAAARFAQGIHTLRADAVDEAGYRSKPATAVVPIDGTAPTVRVLVGFGEPTGTWYTRRPRVAVVAADEPGGSGLDAGAVTYRLNGGPVTTYGGPFLIGEGTFEVCVAVTDRAGNTATTSPCPVVRADLADPVAAMVVAPGDGDTGWYVTPPDVTTTAVETGSGVAVVYASVDTAPFAEAPGGHLTAPSGDHLLRTFVVDAAGRRSEVAERRMMFDAAPPVTVARTLPVSPARGGWYRTDDTRLVLTASDTGGAGVAEIRYAVDAGPEERYDGPVRIAAGVHSVSYRALDRSGPAHNEAARQVTLRVDSEPPVAAPANAAGLVSTLTPTPLRWTVRDRYSGAVAVSVLVLDATGSVVRHIAPVSTSLQGGAANGTTLWDGLRDGGLPALAGVFHYRVVATDDTGNTAQSGESATFARAV